MKSLPVQGIRVTLGLAVMAALVFPVQARCQDVTDRVKTAYFRAVAEHFDVPMQEVNIVGDWDLALDEVPVVFFLSKRAGVSPDALIGLRRRGRSWMEVSARFGLEVGAFHLPLPQGEALGVLTRAYQEFQSHPARDWDQIRLEDKEIVALVNVRALAEQAGVAPLRVLRAREALGSFVQAFSNLRGR